MSLQKTTKQQNNKTEKTILINIKAFKVKENKKEINIIKSIISTIKIEASSAKPKNVNISETKNDSIEPKKYNWRKKTKAGKTNQEEFIKLINKIRRKNNAIIF